MMKKLGMLVFVAAMHAGSALAAGAYDGIYLLQSTGATPVYASVHQNGNAVIATTYTNESSGNVIKFVYPDGQAFLPSVLDTWGVLTGTVTGTTATLSGTTLHRACNQTLTASFPTATTMSVTITAISNTAEGAAQGFQCGALLAVGVSLTFARVF